MQRGDRRPGFLVRAEEPHSVCSETGGLRGPSNLDGRVGGLRCEENVCSRVFELSEGVLPRNAAPIEAERTDGVQCLLPTPKRLKFNACFRFSTGPADGFEQMWQ